LTEEESGCYAITMDAQLQIQELENKIRELRVSQIAELQQKLKEARQNVVAIENEIAALTGKPVAASPIRGRRPRTSSEEVRNRILKALAATPQGLSQKEIADQAGLNYGTVVIYLKNNSREFKTTGNRRSKRYFLK